MRSSTAKKVLREFTAYDRARDRRIAALEKTLTDTLQDLRAMDARKRWRRPKA